MLSVIIPAFNEESRLPLCLENTLEFLSGQDYPFEIIVVNDGSGDNTSSVVKGFSGRFTQVKLIELDLNRGKGFAVKTGMLKATGNLRLFMDADYAIPANFIGSFINVMNNEYDIVIGARGLKETRIIKHQSFTRELAGKMFGKLQKLVLGIPFYDTQCGFKLFTAESAELLFNQIIYECSYFDAEVMYLAFKNNLKIKEMPVDWTHDGTTRMPVGLRRTIDLIRKLFRLKSLHR